MGKTEIRCGMDSSGKYAEAYYWELLKQLEGYFARKGWKRLFLSGGCYWLARTLKQGISVSYFNKTILCIMRVNIPQIDNFHKYLRFGCSG